jgi:predicted amidohydrolase YtcJ
MPRTLITAGTIYGGDPPRPGATAMVLDGHRVTWLGPVGEVPPPVPRARIALGADAVVIPGFIDSHLHMVDLALLGRWVDCRGVRTPEEAVQRLRQSAGRFAEGEWITGWGYTAADVEGGRRPTRDMLDQVSTDRPVLVVESSLHQGAANSAALAAVGWGRQTPRSLGGELERDRRGDPTGMAWERAFSVIAMAARRASEGVLGTDLGAAYREASQSLLEQGITHVGKALTTRDHIERLAKRVPGGTRPDSGSWPPPGLAYRGAGFEAERSTTRWAAWRRSWQRPFETDFEPPSTPSATTG